MINFDLICVGGLGVQEDEDTSVRGTVSLNSISLGLKKVNNEHYVKDETVEMTVRYLFNISIYLFNLMQLQTYFFLCLIMK